MHTAAHSNRLLPTHPPTHSKQQVKKTTLPATWAASSKAPRTTVHTTPPTVATGPTSPRSRSVTHTPTHPPPYLLDLVAHSNHLLPTHPPHPPTTVDHGKLHQLPRQRARKSAFQRLRNRHDPTTRRGGLLCVFWVVPARRYFLQPHEVPPCAGQGMYMEERKRSRLCVCVGMYACMARGK